MLLTLHPRALPHRARPPHRLRLPAMVLTRLQLRQVPDGERGRLRSPLRLLAQEKRLALRPSARLGVAMRVWQALRLKVERVTPTSLICAFQPRR